MNEAADGEKGRKWEGRKKKGGGRGEKEKCSRFSRSIDGDPSGCRFVFLETKIEHITGSDCRGVCVHPNS